MAAGSGKKKGIVAFAAGIVAAPLVGVAGVAFVVGVGLIWYASRDAEVEREEEVAFGFAEPEDIEAEALPGQRKKKRSRRRSSSSSKGTAPRPSPSGDAPRPKGPNDRPALPAPPDTDTEGALKPGSKPASDGDVVDVADLKPAERSDAGPSDNPFAPPAVAAKDPEPDRTRTRSSSEPGPHDFPEDGPSWIPDTFRSVVESGIAILTGADEGLEPTDGAPGTPALPGDAADATAKADTEADDDKTDASKTAAAGTTSTDTEDEEGEADGVADAAAPKPGSDARYDPPPTPGATTRDEDDAPITPSGSGEPSASVVPETSAMPNADSDEGPVPFAPVPAPTPTPAEDNSTTFDNLVAGGMDMVTGKGGPKVAAPPTRTRTRTEMEEEVADYTDPVEGDEGAPLELEEEDLSLDFEEHDAAASFGGAEPDEDEVDITEALDLDDIVIPVRIQTASPGVAVTVDGNDLGASPARSNLSDGDHTVVVGSGSDATTFTIAPMANPDVWCFDTKSAGGYRQVPCD